MGSARKAQYVVSLLLVLGLVILISAYRDWFLGLGTLGYVGIGLACCAANSTVLLPAPSSTVVFTMAGIYAPFWVAVSGGIGATLGEHIGYLAGLTGRRTFVDTEQGWEVQQRLQTYGPLTVLVFAFLPLPIFDLVGVAAGAMKMRYLHFVLPCLLGKSLKMLLYAYAGAGFIPFVGTFIRDLGL